MQPAVCQHLFLIRINSKVRANILRKGLDFGEKKRIRYI